MLRKAGLRVLRCWRRAGRSPERDFRQHVPEYPNRPEASSRVLAKRLNANAAGHGNIDHIAQVREQAARAETKSRFLSRFAADVVSEEFPELAGRMTASTAVLDWRSRNLELIGA
jgi:hypothetical protein